MGVGAAMGLGMLTGMAMSDLTHHHHHGGIYDVNVYGINNLLLKVVIIIITDIDFMILLRWNLYYITS